MLHKRGLFKDKNGCGFFGSKQWQTLNGCFSHLDKPG